MKNLNIKSFAGLAIAFTVSIWLILLYIAGAKLESTWLAFKQLPSVFTIEMVIWGLFVKWGWRFKIFQKWLVPFPFIQGTWKGQLTSTWVNPETQKPLDPIEIVLVIRQTFLSVHCTIMTAESESRSYSASIHIDPESDQKRLVYSYTNKPNIRLRDRSAIHDGTASLLIIGNQPSQLRGEYWTSRKTTGEIDLKFMSRSLVVAVSSKN